MNHGEEKLFGRPADGMNDRDERREVSEENSDVTM